jgi:hypothetical protein
MEMVVFAIGLGTGFALLISGAKVRVLDGPPIPSGASIHWELPISPLLLAPGLGEHRAHNPKVSGSNPAPATNQRPRKIKHFRGLRVSAARRSM